MAYSMGRRIYPALVYHFYCQFGFEREKRLEKECGLARTFYGVILLLRTDVFDFGYAGGVNAIS
jgi:hypothetical protein